jgi:DNA-binding XRE family transcriptional regulator
MQKAFADLGIGQGRPHRVGTLMALYVAGLILLGKGQTAVRMATVLPVRAHDALNRLLRVLPWSPYRLILGLIRWIPQVGEGGYLCLDDVVVAKSFAKLLPWAGWTSSSSQKRYVFGFHIVSGFWCHGRLRIPVGFRLRRPQAQCQPDCRSSPWSSTCGTTKETKTQETESPKDTKTESEQKPTENKTKASESPTPPSADKVEKASFGEQSPTPETIPLLQNTPADKALLKIAQVLVTHLDWVDVDNLLFRHPEVLEAAGIATVETIEILREAGYLELPDPYTPFKRVVEKGGLLYLKYSKKAALIISQAIQEAYPAQAKGIYEISATVPHSGTASSIAEEFKRVRNSLGFSQEQLAQKLGVSRTLVSMVELGQREVEAEVVEKLRALSGQKLQ